jgi:hypothetical protein
METYTAVDTDTLKQTITQERLITKVDLTIRLVELAEEIGRVNTETIRLADEVVRLTAVNKLFAPTASVRHGDLDVTLKGVK